MSAQGSKRASPRLGRRAFLKGGLAIAALGATAGALLELQPTVWRAPRQALKVLDERMFSVLAALADRICPATDGLPSAWELRVPEKVDAWLDTLHEASVSEAILALRLLESGLLGLLLDGRPRAFTACPAEVQDRVLRAWRDSALLERRVAYRALAGLVSSTYWGEQATWRHVGYPGPPAFPPPVPDPPVPEREGP